MRAARRLVEQLHSWGEGSRLGSSAPGRGEAEARRRRRRTTRPRSPAGRPVRVAADAVRRMDSCRAHLTKSGAMPPRAFSPSRCAPGPPRPAVVARRERLRRRPPRKGFWWGRCPIHGRRRIFQGSPPESSFHSMGRVARRLVKRPPRRYQGTVGGRAGAAAPRAAGGANPRRGRRRWCAPSHSPYPVWKVKLGLRNLNKPAASAGPAWPFWPVPAGRNLRGEPAARPYGAAPSSNPSRSPNWRRQPAPARPALRRPRRAPYLFELLEVFLGV